MNKYQEALYEVQQELFSLYDEHNIEVEDSIMKYFSTL